MKLKMACIVLAASFTSSIFASTPLAPIARFAPENDLYIGVEQSRGGIDKATFDELIDRAERIYKPIIKQRGGNLAMVAKWDDGTVNAYTLRQGNSWQVHMFGGLARMGAMTEEGFAMVICHELGHQIGGLPKKTSWWGVASWAAAEGQSDYFSTAKCMKLMYKDQDNTTALINQTIPPVASEKCQEVYSSTQDQEVCLRTSLGALALGEVLASMGGQTTGFPKLETPSTQVVQKTNVSGYPSSQCRVDTYFQGALCDIAGDVDTSESDIHQGYCARENGYTIGTRPLCWFNPADTYEATTSTYEY